MRYYIIGNKDSDVLEYAYAEGWLKLNNNTVINPYQIVINGITGSELSQIKTFLLTLADAVLVLDKSCDTYELSYAKSLGKKVKYLSKQWKLKQQESRAIYNEEICEKQKLNNRTYCERIKGVRNRGNRIITAEEFAEKMNEIVNRYPYDVEARHIKMERLLIETLRQLGYDKGCNVFEAADMWFA